MWVLLVSTIEPRDKMIGILIFFSHKTNNCINKYESSVTAIDGKKILSATSVYDSHLQ